MWSMNLKRSRPAVQNVISGAVLFFAVGIYTAVLNLGAGGGRADSAHINNIVAATLYSVFGVVAFFAGSTLNTIGPRWTMMIGAFGYPFYITGLWCFDKKGSSVYPIIGGAVLGVSAAHLWTVSNYVAFAYGAEHQKGRFYAVQQIINTAGNIVAGIVVFSITHNNSLPDGVPTAVYATFFCLMSLSLVAASFLIRPEQVRRDDGQPLATIFKQESYINELRGCLGLLKDVRTWLILPAMLCVENPLILQPTISAYWFDLRTRSLCILIIAIVQLFAFIIYQAILDTARLSRRSRAYLGLAIFAILLAAGYAGEAGWLSTLAPGALSKPNGIDWTESGFGGFFVIFLILQTTAAIGPMYLCWLISTFTNEPRRVGYYAGFMRSGMACGTSIFFGVAAGGIRLPTQIIVHFADQLVTLLPVLYLVLKYVTNTNYLAEMEVVFIPKHEAEVLDLHVQTDSDPGGTALATEKIPAGTAQSIRE